MERGARLVVLAKPPRPGRCKSRLASEVGDGAAARLARAMLRDVWEEVSSFVSARPDTELVLAIDGEPSEYPLLLPEPAQVRQAEGDLGRRMASLAAAGLGQHDWVLLLGTDSPGLPAAHVETALAGLHENDVVLGPTRDGGFWCLGARRGPGPLRGNTWLDGMDWETGDTRAQVADRLRRLGLSLGAAPEWFDLDRAVDVEHLATVAAAAGGGAAAATLAAWERRDQEPVSVIVASLQEGLGIDDCLASLRRQPGPLEIVVADGGSTDGSPLRAAAAEDVTVVQTAPGRGRQLAAGAALATGPILLFLHADTHLPDDGTDLVRAALADGTAEAGAFVIHTVPDPALPNRVGPLLRLADLRSRTTRHPYGDQAMFATRAAYDAVGGFRALPIMEDYDLSMRLARRRPLARIDSPVAVSGRRIQRRPIRSLVLNRIIPPLYRMGVKPETLARLYGTT